MCHLKKKTTDQNWEQEREGEEKVLEGKVVAKNFSKNMHKEVAKDNIRKVRGIFFVNNVAPKTSKSIMIMQTEYKSGIRIA